MLVEEAIRPIRALFDFTQHGCNVATKFSKYIIDFLRI
jgi:hypothetical protein